MSTIMSDNLTCFTSVLQEYCKGFKKYIGLTDT